MHFLAHARNEPVNKVTGRRFLALGNKYSFAISAGENDFGTGRAESKGAASAFAAAASFCSARSPGHLACRRFFGWWGAPLLYWAREFGRRKCQMCLRNMYSRGGPASEAKAPKAHQILIA
jgi:hypothetical protein